MAEFDQVIQEIQSWQSIGLLTQIAQFIIWAAFIGLLTWLVRKGITKTVADNAMRYRAKKAARLFSYVLIVFLAIVTFTGKMQYFTIAIGLFGAGVAFALQEVILSVAGWIAIFTTKIYKPGDRIEINNVKGDVIDISVTRTTLMEIGDWVSSDNYNGRIAHVSNSMVFKSVVYNYSTDFPFVWDELNLPIHYNSDINLANKIILEAAKSLLDDYSKFAKTHWKEMVLKYLIENAHTEPTLTMNLTDNWVAFNLRYVVDFKKRRITKDKLHRDILTQIRNTNGKVTLASATFELVGAPDFNVDISGNSPSAEVKS